MREDECELRVAVQALQLVRREVLPRVKVVDDAGALGVEVGCVEALDEADARLLTEDSVPKSLPTVSDAGERPDSCDDDACTHEVGFWLSTLRLSPARVRVAM